MDEFKIPTTIEEVEAEEERQAADPNPPELPESLRDPRRVWEKMMSYPNLRNNPEFKAYVMRLVERLEGEVYNLDHEEDVEQLKCIIVNLEGGTIDELYVAWAAYREALQVSEANKSLDRRFRELTKALRETDKVNKRVLQVVEGIAQRRR